MIKSIVNRNLPPSGGLLESLPLWNLSRSGSEMKRAWILAVLCVVPVLYGLAANVEMTCVFADGRTEKKTMPLVQEGSVQRFRWKADAIPSGLKQVELRPEFATAQSGQEGYFVMPNGYLGTFREQNGELSLAGSCMPMFGMKSPRATFVAIVTGLPHAYTLVARAKNGVYTLFPRFQWGGGKPYDDIALEYHLLSGRDADYAGMARAYRQYQLNRKACVPLAERMKIRSGLAYAARSPEIRLRLGWKPAPSPVEEQTIETEPPMKVAITFDRVAEILDEFKRQGIRRAEVTLVGWNRKGHDGRYPQLFPVEEQLGGEAKLRQLIVKAQKMGFQIVGHSNSSDAYRVADVWDEEYIIKEADGKLSRNACWSGGRMYNVCPQRAFERFVPKDLRAVADLGFRGMHYLDVLTIVKPRACFDSRHPLNRNQSAEWISRIMGEGREVFGGIASEGPYDFCCGNLDYVLYVSFNGLTDKPKMVDCIVPVWQLVYHGIILSNPFTETTNYTIKNSVARLKLIEFGGRPLFYFYSKFLEGNKQWMGAEDLTCDDNQTLAASVAKIKEGCDEFEALCHLQTEFMEEHQMIAPDVFRTAFSGGSAIIANYRETDFDYNGTTVKSRAYLVVK